MSASRPPAPGPLLGDSQAMAAVRSFLERAASVGVPVLIVGESGTGKSHLARLLHLRSSRRDGPLVSVNCAGIPDGLFEAEFFGHRRGAFTGASESRPGLFEQASGGTLFLDEIGELPLHQQAKLLAVLEDGCVRRVGATRVRQVDVRVVAATCRDLNAASSSGEFRTDLYHRLALLRCEIPPLRRRPADLDRLVRHLLVDLGERHGGPRPTLAPEARALLHRHSWPGNVRELAHVLEAAVILSGGGPLDRELLSRVLRGDTGAALASPSRSGDRDAVDSYPGEGPGSNPEGRPESDPGNRGGSAPTPPTSPSGEPPAAGSAAGRGGGRRRYSFYGSPDEEREIIRRALARHRGNRTRTARELGMSRNTLRQRMRKYDI